MNPEAEEKQLLMKCKLFSHQQTNPNLHCSCDGKFHRNSLNQLHVFKELQWGWGKSQEGYRVTVLPEGQINKGHFVIITLADGLPAPPHHLTWFYWHGSLGFDNITQSRARQSVSVFCVHMFEWVVNSVSNLSRSAFVRQETLPSSAVAFLSWWTSGLRHWRLGTMERFANTDGHT